MASTSSAAALSAVLRCRGNIWSRNPSNKRPATAGYSLGLTAGAQRDTRAERSRSKRASVWDAFLQGDRVVVGRRLTASYKSPRLAVNTLTKKGFGEKKFGYSKRSLPPEEMDLCDQSAPVRPLARRRVFKLPGVEACSKIILMLKYQTYAEHLCKLASAEEISGAPAGVLNVSIVSPRLVAHAGQLMKTVRSTCRSLPVLVSGMVLLWRSKSSPEGASQMLYQQDMKIKDSVLQANGHSSTDLTTSKGRSSCGPKITEDRPD